MALSDVLNEVGVLHGGFSARSTAYAFTVLSALFRWLIEQRYVLANPFAGVKVRGQAGHPALDTARGFAEGEWPLPRTLSDGLEWSYGWSEPATQRMRFLLDFGYATGLRANELVGAVVRHFPAMRSHAVPSYGCARQLRHASIATTSMHLRGGDLPRSQQFAEAYSSRNAKREPG